MLMLLAGRGGGLNLQGAGWPSGWPAALNYWPPYFGSFVSYILPPPSAEDIIQTASKRKYTINQSKNTKVQCIFQVMSDDISGVSEISVTSFVLPGLLAVTKTEFETPLLLIAS